MQVAAPPRPPNHRQSARALEALREQALIEEARRRARQRRRRNGAAVIVAAGVATAFVLFGASPFGGGSHSAPEIAKPRHPVGARSSPLARATLTLLESPANGVDSISDIAPNGGTHLVWSCPHDRFCGDLVSAAWAPGGRRIALSLTQYGGHSLYPGLHIIDTATGHDRQIIGLTHHVPPRAVTRQRYVTLMRRPVPRGIGCLAPSQLAWSPDGLQIAYVCTAIGRDGRNIVRRGHISTAIHIIDADGTHPRLLSTGTVSAAWPSWSPNGTRIAFSTMTSTDPKQPDGLRHSAVYTLDLNGAHRRLVATDATAPTWSPDGARIAYRSACGRVRIAMLNGRDTTPGSSPDRCSGIGPPGWPAWSPDGTAIAIATHDGIYVVNADGTHSRRTDVPSSDGVTGKTVRPAWRPAPWRGGANRPS